MKQYTKKIIKGNIPKSAERLDTYQRAVAECINDKDGESLLKATIKFVKEQFNYEQKSKKTDKGGKSTKSSKRVENSDTETKE